MSRDRNKRPDRELFKEIRVVLFAVVSWFALSTAGELIGNQANETAFGQTIGHYVLLAAVVVVPAFGVTWLVLVLRDRRRRRLAVDEEDRPPPPQLLAPPRWYRREPLCDREQEVHAALELVRKNGVVAVIGPRDIGTSAVGQAVVQRLVDTRDADADDTYRFDLRSRSTRGPDDATATAGRVVSAFGIDAPTDDTDEVLARVAQRLVGEFRDAGGALMLDNVTDPEQVRWLVREWPAGGPPWLVIAGETAIGEDFEDGTVEVGQLSLTHLREIWDAELRVPEPRRTKRLRNRVGRGFGKLARRLPWVDASDDLDTLLRFCLGRPRAVKAFANEIRRPDSNVTLEDLLTALDSAGLTEGPLERVWTAILNSIREGLSEDAVWLLHALAELPVTGLTTGAVVAMVGDDEAAALDELWIRSLVEHVDGRYRLPQEIRHAIGATSTQEERLAVALRALPALLRYYAKHAESWAVRLDTAAEHARAWFRVSEASLWPLFSTEHYQDDELLAQVLDDLVSIADALEKWYVRDQQPSGLLKVNRELYPLVERADRPEQAALAAVRMATALRMSRKNGDAVTQLDIARSHVGRVRDDRVRSELDTRAEVERALLAMNGAEPDAVVGGLDRVLPNGRGMANHPCVPTVLVNLGALCLGAGRTTDALKYLHQAEQLAADDPGCAAHSIELQGIALSQLDHRLIDAARRWQRARTMFAHIGEDQGEARCLQHLGAAALTDPRVAGQLRDGWPDELSAAEAARIAIPLLEQAKALRAGQPDTGLTDHYLSLARTHVMP